MLKFKTYAENVRVAANTGENPQRRPVMIREIANATGYSYEHIRKLWSGKSGKGAGFSLSRECNDNICAFLGLPKDEMWQLAEREKFSQKVGYVPMQLIEDPAGRELSELWSELNPHQHGILLEMARGFAAVPMAVSR